MKRAVLKRRPYRNPFFTLMISLAIALIGLALTTTSSAHAESAAESQQTTAQESRQTDVRELKTGEPIEREMAGGQAHSYRLGLTKGQYLMLLVEQRGIDLVVSLFGPDNKQIISVENPTSAHAPPAVEIVADAIGSHRVEVRARNKEVPTGQYRIKMEELREATSRDQVRATAAKLTWEGNRLRDQGTADSLRQAIKKYEEATTLWRSVDERNGEASAINETGYVHAMLGDPQKGLEYYHQALLLWRAVGNHLDEAGVLHNTGMAHVRLGKPRDALSSFEPALKLWRALEDRLGEAFTLNSTGMAYNMLGEQDKSLDYFSQALKLWRALRNQREEARTLNNMGASSNSLGDKQRALDYFRQSLPLRQVLGDHRGEAVTLHNIGSIYRDLGESKSALNYFEKALLLTRTAGDRRHESMILGGIGSTYKDLDEPEKALEAFIQALTLNRAVKDTYNEAYTLSGLGMIHLRMGQTQKALDYFGQALALRRTAGDRYGEAYSLANIGDTYASLREPEKASTSYSEALLLARAIGDRSNEAQTLQAMARVERDRGNLDVARNQIERALDIIESTRAGVTSRDLRTSFLASKQDYYEFYIDVLMQMHRVQPVAGYETIAFQASERARARGLLEILTEARADIRQGVDPVLLRRERSLLQQLSSMSERLTRLLSGKHTEQQARAARKEVEDLIADYESIQAEIRLKSPRYAALTQTQRLSLKEIQSLLDEDSMLLEYAIGAERSYLWAVTRTAIKSFELPKRAEIETAARRAYSLLTTRNQWVKFEEPAERRARITKSDAEFAEVGRELSRVLFGPISDHMNKRLLIVSDGVLQYIPFAALPLPNSLGRSSQGVVYGPLISKHEVVNLPSASTLGVLRKELTGRKPAPKFVAVFADPVFDRDDERVKTAKVDKKAGQQGSDRSKTQGEAAIIESKLTRSIRDLLTDEDESRLPLPRLRFTREEADAVVAFAPPNQYEKAIDFSANREAAVNPALSDYRYVHFATHALLNTTHPELSGVVLSLVNQEGVDQDGFLLAHQVYNLKLPAELVVLSGCRTGLGKEIKGEGIVGLTRGFMYAGAARVLVSLWDVNDKSTAALMGQFYKEMLGKKQQLSPAAALRQAQLKMWRSNQWQAPYYWAAFVLHGEYR